MKFKAITLIAVLLVFITVPAIYSFMDKTSVMITSISIQEEEENHKYFQFDTPDYLLYNDRNHLFIFQNKARKFPSYYSFVYCSGFIETHCPPPELLQNLL